MTNNVEKYKDIKITYDRDNIYVTIDNSRFPIVQMVPVGEMYSRGLEKYHKPLVDMEDLSESLAYILQCYINTGRFSAFYEHAIQAFKPFIIGYLPLSSIDKKIDEKDEWILAWEVLK